MGLAGLLLIIGLLGAVAVGGLIVQQLHQFKGVLTPGPDMSVARDRPIVVALERRSGRDRWRAARRVN